MFAMLIAYDAGGNVVATQDFVAIRNVNDEVVGFVDFDAHERANGEHLDIWKVDTATGSKVWPEWIGAAAHDFKVELSGSPGRKHISALVHKTSGHRRERAAIEAAIQERINASSGEPADIRDLVGGPNRPLLLDEHGRTKPRPAFVPSKLPILSVDKGK